MSRLFDKARKLTVTQFLSIASNAFMRVAGVDIANDELTALAIGSRAVAGGSALTLSKALHGSGRTVLFDTAAGTTLTLPAATGTGVRFRCLVSVLATTNSHVLACAGTDEFHGHMMGIDVDSGDATLGFSAVAADNFDKITFNRSTSGIAGPGDYIEVEDVVSGVWQVNGAYHATDIIITPFSTT